MAFGIVFGVQFLTQKGEQNEREKLEQEYKELMERIAFKSC